MSSTKRRNSTSYSEDNTDEGTDTDYSESKEDSKNEKLENDSNNSNKLKNQKETTKSNNNSQNKRKSKDGNEKNTNVSESVEDNEEESNSGDSNERNNTVKPQTVETSNNRKIDRYGSYYQEDEPNEDENSLMKEESRKETSRELKWAYMTKNWNSVKPKVLHRRIKKGIPDCMRSLAWRLLLDPQSQDPNVYNLRPSIKSLVQKGRQECCNIIEVDLPRTMPQMEMFQKTGAINSLRSILHAYSNYDSDLGYTQGMAFYAAMLLCYMEEEQSFWCFVSLMRGKRHHLRNVFSPGFPALDKIGKVWEYTLNHHFKNVAEKLNDIGLSTIMYVPSWFMCNFFNMPFPIVLKLRLFDCFLGFGTRAIFSFAITIIKMNKDVLLKSTMEEALQILQRPYEFERMKNWRMVLKNWQSNFISESHYRNLFKKAGVKFIP